MSIAMIGWVMLIGFPSASFTDWTIWNIIVISLALAYLLLLFLPIKLNTGEKYPKGDFKNFQGIVNFFKNPKVVLVGWIHYLSFDLLVGMMIKNDALQQDIAHWQVVPCLLLTLFFGPLGVLAYFLLGLIV